MGTLQQSTAELNAAQEMSASQKKCGSSGQGCCGSCRAQDRAVEQAALRHLETHPHFRGRTSLLELKSRKGALTVRGCLPTFYLKQLLQTALMQVEDVGELRNEVEVYPGLGCEQEPSHRAI